MTNGKDSGGDSDKNKTDSRNGNADDLFQDLIDDETPKRGNGKDGVLDDET